MAGWLAIRDLGKREAQQHLEVLGGYPKGRRAFLRAFGNQRDFCCLAQLNGNVHRRILAQNVGYFERHRNHMDYPTYRARGGPIGSGVVESGVKQFNHRVKGTDRFWNTAGSEAILALRAFWLSQDGHRNHYWLYGRLRRKAA